MKELTLLQQTRKAWVAPGTWNDLHNGARFLYVGRGGWRAVVWWVGVVVVVVPVSRERGARGSCCGAKIK